MIDRINPNQISQVEQTSKRESNDFATQFEECLNQALGQAQETGEAQTGLDVASLGSIQEILVQQTSGGLVSMEKALDLMDQLAEALEDPETSSASLAPLMNDLDEQARELMAEADNLEQGDRVRSLLEDTAVTAMVQVSKYERGDFF